MCLMLRWRETLLRSEKVVAARKRGQKKTCIGNKGEKVSGQESLHTFALFHLPGSPERRSPINKDHMPLCTVQRGCSVTCCNTNPLFCTNIQNNWCQPELDPFMENFNGPENTSWKRSQFEHLLYLQHKADVTFGIGAFTDSLLM